MKREFFCKKKEGCHALQRKNKVEGVTLSEMPGLYLACRCADSYSVPALRMLVLDERVQFIENEMEVETGTVGEKERESERGECTISRSHLDLCRNLAGLAGGEVPLPVKAMDLHFLHETSDFLLELACKKGRAFSLIIARGARKMGVLTDQRVDD